RGNRGIAAADMGDFMATVTKWGGEAFIGAPGTTGFPYTAALADGRFITAFHDTDHPGYLSTGIFGIISNADGSTAVPEFQINTNDAFNQYFPVAVGLANGGFAVVWQDDSGADGPDPDPGYESTNVRMQIYGPDGAPVGTEVIVNTERTDSQHDPAITSLVGG